MLDPIRKCTEIFVFDMSENVNEPLKQLSRSLELLGLHAPYSTWNYSGIPDKRTLDDWKVKLPNEKQWRDSFTCQEKYDWIECNMKVLELRCEERVVTIYHVPVPTNPQKEGGIHMLWSSPPVRAIFRRNCEIAHLVMHDLLPDIFPSDKGKYFSLFFW